jgi:hypothetical protein
LYPSQLPELAGSLGLMSAFVVGVATLMNDVSHMLNPYLELEEKYGVWAVESAIAVCPRNDWECIEREAKRLYESRIYRR